MLPFLSDIHREVENIQFEIIRNSSVSQRIQVMRSLTATTIDLSRRAIQRANPGFTEQDVDIAFVDLHYGRDLAESLRNYFGNKNS